MNTKASCGHWVEDTDDLYTLYQIYYDVNENGETTGIMNSSECKECFDKAIIEGYGYRSEEEVWDVIKKRDYSNGGFVEIKDNE